jgi:hypothetical protein
MDEQGKVIDGTARARHWRRSRPQSAADTDGAEAHSDAPKSIAASLLVPAEMLDDPLAPEAGEPASPTNGTDPATPIAGDGSSPPPDLSLGAERQNPFLAADAAVVAPSRERRKHHDGRVIGLATAATQLLASLRIRRLIRPTRVGGLVVLVVLVIAAAELARQSHTTSPTTARASGRTAAIAGLARLKQASLPAVARALAAIQTAGRQHATHVWRARRSGRHHSTNHATHRTAGRSGGSSSRGSVARSSSAESSAISTTPATNSYTPSQEPSTAAGGATSSSPTVSSSSDSGTSSSSSAPSSSRAFGQGGALGPGHSPSS